MTGPVGRLPVIAFHLRRRRRTAAPARGGGAEGRPAVV
jgi:hypothetical protein